MRCYFLNDGHITAVEVLTASSDEDAIKQAQVLFREFSERFSGFEVWDRTRFIHRYKDSVGG